MSLKPKMSLLLDAKRFRRRRRLHPLLVILCLSALTWTANSQDFLGNETVIKVSPLQLTLQDNEVSLRVGENRSFSIINTSYYDPDLFVNKSIALIFLYSVGVEEVKDYIEVLPDVTLTPNFTTALRTIQAHKAGRLIITSKLQPPILNYTTEDIFVRVNIYKLAVLSVICEVVGWIYFVAWSFSFYPQIVQNFTRKSVRGLSFEFVALNITGFAVYSLYNVGLFFFSGIQDEYFAKDPTGSIPVEVNDVVFSLHALFASTLIGFQCLVYERGSQNVSYTGRTLLCAIGVFLFVMFVVTVSNAISWLAFLNYCSYVKLFITLVKYVPQAYLNYTRKSTSGWCIGNVLLDFTGGAFSILQMLLIAYNHDDWYSIFGDLTKFGLGLFSITFDIFFILQHYVLYRNHREYEPIEGSPDPVLNPHEDMTTSNHMQSSYEEQGNMPHSASVDSIPPEATPGGSMVTTDVDTYQQND